jgi:hypothetical protein
MAIDIEIKYTEPYLPLSGPQGRSGRNEEEKILDPAGILNSHLSVIRPIASHCTHCVTTALEVKIEIISFEDHLMR